MSLNLEPVLADQSVPRAQRLRFLAALSLGLVDSLENHRIGFTDAEGILFRGRNYHLVTEHCDHPLAQRILARGMQLSDLQDVLPPDESARALSQEFAALGQDAITLLRETYTQPPGTPP